MLRPSRFVAEAVSPISRRGLISGCACACGVGALGVRPARAAQAGPTRPEHATLDSGARAIEARMVAWRRDFHANPDLGNQESRTAAIVAAHLRGLGLDVRERVAVTGIVATLKGGLPGPVIALRADMDALPVAEEVALPYASRKTADWDGGQTPVMHACGHDCHTAILMAAAEVLAANRATLRGTIKFIFQPAEENLPQGEIGGARRMLAEGAFETPRPDVVFGLHMVSGMHAGLLGYSAGNTSASADEFRIQVNGRQTHGARPWAGVDPIVIGAQIVTALQTIESRQVDVGEPSVLTVGTFEAGNRSNIIPDHAVMTGTLRTYDPKRRAFMQRRVNEIARDIAHGMDGSADVLWQPNGYPVLVSNVALTERMVPSLARVGGADGVRVLEPAMAAEDFAFFANEVPGMFFRVGATAPDIDPRTAPPNHSPRFHVDDSGMLQGLRATLHIVADYPLT